MMTTMAKAANHSHIHIHVWTLFRGMKAVGRRIILYFHQRASFSFTDIRLLIGSVSITFLFCCNNVRYAIRTILGDAEDESAGTLDDSLLVVCFFNAKGALLQGCAGDSETK
jgi:hypothetical protein